MELTKSLEHRRAYEKLEEICRRAVRMDPQEETVYCRFYTADRKEKVQVLSGQFGKELPWHIWRRSRSAAS